MGRRGSQRRKRTNEKRNRCNEGMRRKTEQGSSSTKYTPGVSYDDRSGQNFRNIDPNRTNLAMLEKGLAEKRRNEGMQTNGIPRGSVGLDTVLVFHGSQYIPGREVLGGGIMMAVETRGRTEQQLSIIHDSKLSSNGYRQLAAEQQWVTGDNLTTELGLPNGITGIQYAIRCLPEEATALLEQSIGEVTELKMDVRSTEGAKAIQSHFIDLTKQQQGSSTQGRVYAMMFYEGYPDPDRIYVIHDRGFELSMLPENFLRACSGRETGVNRIPIVEGFFVSGYQGNDMESVTYDTADALNVRCGTLLFPDDAEDQARKIIPTLQP